MALVYSFDIRNLQTRRRKTSLQIETHGENGEEDGFAQKSYGKLILHGTDLTLSLRGFDGHYHFFFDARADRGMSASLSLSLGT